MREESDILFDSDTTSIDYSFILNTNDLKKNLTKFATLHVLLNNQIQNILFNEKNANFDNFPFEELESSHSEADFKQALASSGIINYNDLGNLVLSQSRNTAGFLYANKDFSILKEETKQRLISDAIHDAVTENPIIWPPIDDDNTTTAFNLQARI